MTIEDLKKQLDILNADYEIIFHEKPIKSKNDAKGLFNINETAPTLIVKTEKGFFALIFSGERNNIDFDSIKQLMRLNEFRMAKSKEMKDLLHLVPGQVPLIGHNLSCIIDNMLFKNSYIYGGSGDLFHTLKIKPADLVEANDIVFKFD